MPHQLRLCALACALLSFCLLPVASTPRVLAQATGVTATAPIPPNTDWDTETQNAVNAINALRGAQQPALPPLQVDAVLQNIAAWMANNQFGTKNCLAQASQGVISCNPIDTLGRLATDRLGAFGYQSGPVLELWGYDSIDGVGDTTTGQGMVNTWTNSTSRGAPKQTILSPSLAVGIARQCQNGVCGWWAYFGPNLQQAFGPAAQTAAAQPAPTGPSFSGTWMVDSFVLGPGGPVALVQNGNQINGTYTFADPSGCGTMSGTLQGTVTGNAATFSTTITGCGPNNGVSLPSVIITLSADGKSFTSNGGAWDGALPGAAVPPPNNPQITTNPQQTTPNPTPTPTFAGTWFVDSWGTGGSGGTITFAVNGNQLTGTYSTPFLNGCTINGTVTGTITGLVATINSTETTCAGPPPAGGGGVQGETLTLDPSGKFFGGSNAVWNGTLAGNTTN